MSRCKVCGKIITDNLHPLTWVVCDEHLEPTVSNPPICITRTPERWWEGTEAQRNAYRLGWNAFIIRSSVKVEDLDPDLQDWYAVGWNMAATFEPNSRSWKK